MTAEQNYAINVNFYKCTGCGDCMTACPENQDAKREVGYLDESNAVILVKSANVQVIHESLCTGCGSCIPACPVSAIDIVMKGD
ncbi:4Fe-4S dicluster domain-containing protein [Candidatus Bathyarchaeota archaeon]|nr:4Fe-4S dicluster domain-containing protein [Candidatus Bathyarchaeota archaeon]